MLEYGMITLMGIEEFYNEHDGKSVFDDIRLPEGIDKDVLVPFIITRAGDMPLLYTNPYYIQGMTTNWFAAHYDNFEAWLKALELAKETNPLENYDRTEEWHDRGKSETKESDSDTTTTTDNNRQTHLVGDSTDTVAAFNSSSYEPHDKTHVDNTSTASGSTTNKTDYGRKSTYTPNLDRTGHVHGNIGTVTMQDMLKQQIEVYAWNVYEEIARMYVSEFCIPILS